MTYLNLMRTIKAMGDTVEMFRIGNTLHVNLVDFLGFTKTWDEIYSDYDFTSFIALLNNNATSIVKNYYTTYTFNGFSVKLGYTSFDI